MNANMTAYIRHNRAKLERYRQAREAIEAILKDPETEVDAVDEYKLCVAAEALQVLEDERLDTIKRQEAIALAQQILERKAG